jgi:hypothetical protein
MRLNLNSASGSKHSGLIYTLTYCYSDFTMHYDIISVMFTGKPLMASALVDIKCLPHDYLPRSKEGKLNYITQ